MKSPIRFSLNDTSRSLTVEMDENLCRCGAHPSQVGGEPVIICVGAVIANAFFDAVGARFLQLPMTPDRVRKAISVDRQ